MKVIIVEGIDRVGKTTLINKLKEKANFVQYSYKNYFDTTKKEKVRNADPELTKKLETRELISCLSWLEALKDTNINIVIDRLYFSEYAYGLVYRGYTNTICAEIDNKIKELGIDLLTVFVNPTNIEESMRQHGDRELLLVQDVFDSLKKLTVNKCLICDYNKIDATIAYIVKNFLGN